MKKHFFPSAGHVFLLTMAACFFLYSCNRQQTQDTAIQIKTVRVEKPDTHRWYYLTKDGITETALPSEAPRSISKLWTDALRLSSAVQSGSTAYFTVNTKGLLVVDSTGSFQLKQDVKLFPEKTAGNLMMAGDNPLFHLYENTVLELEADPESVNTQSLSDIPFLAMYNTENGTFFPGPDRNSFSFPLTSEVTQVYFNNGELYLSVKNSSEKKNDFTYYKMEMPLQLADFILTSRNKAANNFRLEEIDEDTFEETLTPKPFADSPARLRELLAVIPEDFPFSVTLSGSATGSDSPKTWLNQQSPEKILETGIPTQTANGIMEESYIMVLFPDGTGYFAGSLPGRHILNEGKPFCFILPDLPTGYKYGVVALSGTIMTAAWEESAFYETGRAGFIVIDMDKVFYN